MPTTYLIALSIALLALLASLSTPSHRTDPYSESPLLTSSTDTGRMSALDGMRTGGRGF